MKTVFRVVAEITVAFALMLVMCAVFVAGMIPTDAQGAETEPAPTAFTQVIVLRVDGLADKIIAVSSFGMVAVFDQSEISASNELWTFLQQATELGIVVELDVQTPCGVGK